MPATTTAYTKNTIRRSIRELVDPSPNRQAIDVLWKYFDSCCAYCGRNLDRARKEGHIDHLVPSSQGGANGLSNRVLSCATCNEKEKLDTDWQRFLDLKVEDAKVRNERLKKIETWIERNGRKTVQLSNVQLQQIDAAAQRVTDCYDAEVRHIRATKNMF